MKCPKCGSDDVLHVRGYVYGSDVYALLYCLKCGTYFLYDGIRCSIVSPSELSME